MAVSRKKKEASLEDLKANFKSAKSVFFSTYRGLSVNDISLMRADLRTSGSRMMVAKKSLIKLAAKEVDGVELPDESMPGPVACIFSMEDEVAAAKVVAKWAKTKKEIVALVGGVFEGKAITKAQAVSIASIPSREELLAKLLGSMQAPISGFVRSLKSPLAGFTQVLREVSKR